MKKTRLAANHSLLIQVLVVFITIIGPFAADLYVPSLPVITQKLNATTTAVQLSITVYFMGLALSQLIYGPLSDRFGRRNVLLSGMIIAFLGSFLCALAATAPQLLLWRFIQGCGIGAGAALSRAIMRDTFYGKQLAQAISYNSMAFVLAPAAAPIIGGYLQHWFGWQANFLFLAGYTAIIWILVYSLLPETNSHPNRAATQFKVICQNYSSLVTNRIFIGFLVCASLAFSGMVAYMTTSPFLFESLLGLTPVEYGWLGVYIAAGLIVGRIINSLLVYRLSSQTIITLGISGLILAGVIMWSFGYAGIINIPVIMVPMTLFVVSTGFILPNAMAASFTPFAKMAGTAGAMFGFLNLLGCILTSAIVAELAEPNQLILANIFIALGILAMVLFYSFRPWVHLAEYIKQKQLST